MSRARDTAFVLLQYLLPQHALSRLTGALAGSTLPFLKDWLIGRFITAFGVDMREAAEPEPRAYPHFNAFFTRALRAGARPVDAAAEAIVSPADGAVSQAGEISGGRILQAKGRSYTAAELLADAQDAALFEGGSFATIYLSPRDYHRVHMPCDARLTMTVLQRRTDRAAHRLLSRLPAPRQPARDHRHGEGDQRAQQREIKAEQRRLIDQQFLKAIQRPGKDEGDQRAPVRPGTGQHQNQRKGRHGPARGKGADQGCDEQAKNPAFRPHQARQRIWGEQLPKRSRQQQPRDK